MSKRAKQPLRPYFEVGHKVQLQPVLELHPFPQIANALKGYHATITRIEQLPDPAFLDIETQEEWEDFLRIRRVLFWVKLDDPTGLDDYYQEHEYQCYYRELQPLPPRMTHQQLADYCQQRLRNAHDEQRRDAYLQALLFLRQDGHPSWPLSKLDQYRVPERGHTVDLINRFISVAAQIRELERFEVQAQVCEELSQQLIPKQHTLVQEQFLALERRLKQLLPSDIGTR